MSKHVNKAPLIQARKRYAGGASITTAPIRGVDLERPNTEPDLIEAVPVPIDYINWDLSFWENLQLAYMDAKKAVGYTWVLFARPAIQIIIGRVLMKNTTKGIIAIVVGAIVAALRFSGITDLPIEVEGGIVTVLAFIAGLFFKSPAEKVAP